MTLFSAYGSTRYVHGYHAVYSIQDSSAEERQVLFISCQACLLQLVWQNVSCSFMVLLDAIGCEQGNVMLVAWWCLVSTVAGSCLHQCCFD